MGDSGLFLEVSVDFDEFVRVVESIRAAHPEWFPDLLPPDAPATDQQVREAQAQLGVQLPAEYVAFVQRYGGGVFGFCVVYSLDPTSKDHLVTQNSPPWSRPDFVAVSPNGAGDHYGFAVHDGHCASELLFLDHETGTLEPTAHADLLEFVVATLRSQL